MTDVHEKIRSRGHWDVIIHPTSDEPREESLGQLEQIVRGHAVQLRGWDYPHIDTHNPVLRGLDWVGQEYEWMHYLGKWRLHSNGLFLSTEGLPIDWRDQSDVWPPDRAWQPNQLLGMSDALYSLTEFVEFASRLSTTPVGDTEMTIEVTLKGAKGRLLYSDSPGRGGMYREYRSGVDEIPVRQTVERTRLIGDAWTIAAEMCQRLLSVFGWDTNTEALLDHQKELRRA